MGRALLFALAGLVLAPTVWATPGDQHARGVGDDGQCARRVASLRPPPTLRMGAAAPTTPVGRALLDGIRRKSWSTQPVGRFLSGRIDFGLFFLRPRISLGYGRAHDLWAGIETNPIITNEGIAIYAGLRLALAYVDVRVGGRYQYAFRRSFLGPKADFERDDIELREGPRSSYLTWEIEVTSSIPIGRSGRFGAGDVFVELGGAAVTGVNEGWWVYEETLRAVIEPPWVWRAMIGYLLRPLDSGALRIGPVVQTVGIPGRDLIVWRAGVLARMRLAYNLELRGNFVPVASSRDHLGFAGADAFQLGIRYLWAYTGR